MARNLKLVGLAIMASAVFSAAAAPTASGTIHFPASFGTTIDATLLAEQTQEHKFTMTGQTVTCKLAAFDGVAPSGAFASFAVAATYAECKSEPLGVNATVSGFGNIGQLNKCWFVFEAEGGAELVCSGTGEVTVTALTCQVHIPAQTFAKGLSYSQGFMFLGGGVVVEDIGVSFNVEKIKGNHTDGFLCPFSAGGVSETGVLEGQSTFVAFDEGELTDAWYSSTFKIG